MNEARCIAYRDDGAICREPVPTEAELARREGRLYKPASALLERIKAECQTQEPSAKRKRRLRTATGRRPR